VPETLLKTKLFIPQLRPNLVSRPRLAERINRGFTHYVHLFGQLCGDSPFGGGYRVALSG
jgi:ATP/maltotriose-dependent transcriptional regulator MalT